LTADRRELAASHRSRRRAQRAQTRALAFAAAAVCLMFVGCAAITNPVANGVPARLLPEELKAETREGFEQIPLTLLRQPPPESYVLQSGDTLAIYIEGVIGSANVPPPVNVPDLAELPPSIGYPMPIRDDGTISLPLVGAVHVAGDTIEKAELRVIKAYVDGEYLTPDKHPILVTLMRPRSVRVLVVREDSAQRQVTLRNDSLLGLGTTETTVGGGRRSEGQVLELPAYENDVLNALARTGGLPGLESTQEVIIQRGYWNPRTGVVPGAGAGAGSFPLAAPAAGEDRPRVTRIPLRIRPGESVTIDPEDVILQNGDIVTIRGREPTFYYTGGLLPSGEYPLPMDYDLTVVEAVLKSRGPLLNGGLNANNLNGAVVGGGLGNPSPNQLTVLRKTQGNGQVTIRVDLDEAVRDPRQNLLVQAGDILILQESPDQAVSRYFSAILQGNFFIRWLDRGDAQGTGSVVVP
jgi:protein involved in polysaccharide export with SLBB domain